MAKTTVTYIDRKGEPGAIQFSQGTFAPTFFVTNFCPLSYAGFADYHVTTETALTNPPAVGVDALVNNDKDFKAILGFEGLEGIIKISIPAPKINIEAGIIVRWGQNRAIIPPVKAVGEVGKDGADLVNIIQGCTGLTGLKFKFGRLIKRS